MKALFFVAIFFGFTAANANSFTLEESVNNSKVIQSLVVGIEAENQVRCDVLKITKGTGDDFSATTTCKGTDAYGDEYGVIVDLTGVILEQVAYVQTVNLNYAP